MSRILALATIFGFGGAFPAAAQGDDYARSGAYFGIAGSFAVFADLEGERADEVEAALAARGTPRDVVLESDDPVGLNARVGYRAHPRVAGELQFEWLPNIDLDEADETVEEFETWALTANARGYLLTGRYQPFLLAGLGLAQADARDKKGLGLSGESEDFVARFGAGVDVYATPNIVLTVDAGYLLGTGSVDFIDYFALGWGIQYRF